MTLFLYYTKKDIVFRAHEFEFMSLYLCFFTNNNKFFHLNNEAVPLVYSIWMDPIWF